ncbi:hypothetical protein PAPYR_4378 [Paratrimastix pyriformis]|uniref:Uncharacterized protein n=1 Tax=Paratrimastix pyriformis TaxID=342808 RepID=A0ABQ8UPI5_9EUKA|nr:hypothetical protein PAPYR_4378 [Paratrimastix pyriformis]
MQYKQNNQAVKYVAKVSDPVLQCELLFHLGMIEDALLIAQRVRDQESLWVVHGRLADTRARQALEGMLAQSQEGGR